MRRQLNNQPNPMGSGNQQSQSGMNQQMMPNQQQQVMNSQFGQQPQMMNPMMNQGISQFSQPQMFNPQQQQMYNPQQQQMYNPQQQQMFNPQQQMMMNQPTNMMNQRMNMNPQQQMMIPNQQIGGQQNQTFPSQGVMNPQQMMNFNFQQPKMMNQQSNPQQMMMNLNFSQPQQQQVTPKPTMGSQSQVPSSTPQQVSKTPQQPQVIQQPKPAQGIRPTLFDGLELHEIPVYPIREEDCIYLPPKPFQKPLPDARLPQELLNNITQEEDQMASEALAPLQMITGQQFYFYCDYYELMMHKKYVEEEDIPALCTNCGNVLKKWVTAIVNWFNDIKKNSHPDNRWYIRKFLEACSTRYVTVKLDIDGPKQEGPRNGRMFFENGVLVIFCIPGSSWMNSSIAYPSFKGAMAGHHPFRAIENALDERGMIEAQMYFQKTCVKKYLDTVKLINDTFGCEWTFEFDAQELFRNYDLYVEKYEKSTFFCMNYVWARQFHKHHVIVYFEKMVARIVEAVTVNGSVDPVCVKAVLEHIPTKTIVLELAGNRDNGWYNLEFLEGKMVMRINYWWTNMEEMFEGKALNKNCLETKVIVEKIPLIAYKNLHEKANAIKEDCKVRLEKITGQPWVFPVNLPLTYKKLLQANSTLTTDLENFPTILMCYVLSAVEKIEKWNERIQKLAPEQQVEPVEEEELDSDEEEDEEVKISKLSGPTIPFNVKDVLLSNIPTRTINVKFLTKISSPIEPWHFTSLKDGKMVIKIIAWNTNRSTVLGTEKTGFGKIFLHQNCPLSAWMDYFEKQAKNEIVLKDALGKCLGTPPWVFDYNMGEIYQFVVDSKCSGGYVKQVGWQFMKYFEELVKFITLPTRDVAWKNRFKEKFSQKRTIRMTCGGTVQGRGSSYFQFVESDGVLEMNVKQWLVNLTDEIRKLEKFV